MPMLPVARDCKNPQPPPPLTVTQQSHITVGYLCTICRHLAYSTEALQLHYLNQHPHQPTTSTPKPAYQCHYCAPLYIIPCDGIECVFVHLMSHPPEAGYITDAQRSWLSIAVRAHRYILPNEPQDTDSASEDDGEEMETEQ